MIKICMIVPNVYPVPAVKGGAVETLVDLFARVNEERHEVELTVVSPWDDKANSASKAYRNTNFVYIHRKLVDSLQDNPLLAGLHHIIVRKTGHSFGSNAYIRRLYQKIKEIEFDWIIIEGGTYEIYSYLIKKIGYDRMIFHLHGEYVGTQVLAKWFSHYICVSNFIARRLILNGIIQTENVDVLKNGIVTENFQIRDSLYSRENERGKFGFSDENVVFVYWGRLIPEKGVKELLKAFRKVCQVTKNTKLLVIGSAEFDMETATDYEKELESLKKGLPDKIIFTGFIKNDELWHVLHAADVAVLPSICDDAALLTGIEAGAAGLPCISTNVGGIPEYLAGGGTIILDWSMNFVDDLANAMIILADDMEMRKRLGTIAYENAKKFNEKKYYNNYVNILKKYCQEKESKSGS